MHVRFQSFHTSTFWKSAMYFSVMIDCIVAGIDESPLLVRS